MTNKKAIIIFGGGMVKDKGVWRTTNLDEGTALGALGDRLRVEAANILYKKNPQLMIVASGGKGMYRDINDAPPVAEIIKKELIDLGVKSQSIYKEEQSDTTWQQLQELINIIKDKELSQAIVVSNRYHLPRILAMIESDNELCELLKENKIQVISAEEILIKHDPEKWQHNIDNVYNSEEMKKKNR